MAYSLRKQPKKDFVSLNEGPPLPADLDDEESHDEFGEAVKTHTNKKITPTAKIWQI